jgi:hypothetical protein
MMSPEEHAAIVAIIVDRRTEEEAYQAAALATAVAYRMDERLRKLRRHDQATLPYAAQRAA